GKETHAGSRAPLHLSGMLRCPCKRSKHNLIKKKKSDRKMFRPRLSSRDLLCKILPCHVVVAVGTAAQAERTGPCRWAGSGTLGQRASLPWPGGTLTPDFVNRRPCQPRVEIPGRLLHGGRPG